MTFPTTVLLLGLAVTVIGFVAWRSGGKRLAPAGATFIAFGMWLRETGTGMRTLWLAIYAVLVLTAFAGSRREYWRRPEVLFLAGTAVALWASVLLANVVSRGVHAVLLVLLALLAASSVVLMIRLVFRDSRALRSSGTK